MKSMQAVIKAGAGADSVRMELGAIVAIDPNLVLAFGGAEHFSNGGLASRISQAFPKAIVLGCSTAGEISKDGVSDQTLVVTGAQFSRARLKAARANLQNMEGSRQVGMDLGKTLAGEGSDLRSVFVLGQGVNINGSELIQGIQAQVGQKVLITGGLAGDGGKFEKTYTLLGGEISSSHVVAVGFYGDGVSVGYGSMGGWDPFGPARRVTRADKNVLYELDGEPALGIYKKYLGDQAKGLPGAGLLFPFAILKESTSYHHEESGLIRTILAVDEQKGSLTFAGDIPSDRMVRLMHANSRGLLAGAQGAAKLALGKGKASDGLAILVSCVGRKLVMGVDVDDEVEAVQAVFGARTLTTGFYSYGEICPLGEVKDVKLHNQTMTVTYISEDGSP